MHSDFKNKIFIQINSNFLSKNSLEDYFSSYYPDAYIYNIYKSDNNWVIEYGMHCFNHCESINDGLRWLNTTKHKITDYFINGDDCFFTLLDSWVLYSWSIFFKKTNIDYDKQIVLLHLDDHKDLMPTRIKVLDKRWYDLMTEKPICFEKPETIYNAIKSGALGIGSYITPLLHKFSKIKILHLKNNIKNSKYNVKPTMSNDLLIDLGAKVMISSFCTSSKYCNYHASSDINNLLFNIPKDSTILLHIDMDYFNNRFNGNTNWEQNSNNWNPNINEQYQSMDYFVEQLSYFNIVHNIKHLSIALSPSFYPCEYWKSGTTYLFNKLSSLGVNLKLYRIKEKLNIQ